jgi:hypothetical protein
LAGKHLSNIKVAEHTNALSGISADALLATWRNGSHRLLWQGPVGHADSDSEVTLGTISAHQSRIYYLSITLSEDLDNSAQGGQAKLRMQLQIIDNVAAATSTTAASPPKSERLATLDFGQVLGILPVFRLPGLSQPQALIPASPPAVVVEHLVASAHQLAWLSCLLLGLELLALRPWYKESLPRFEVVLVGFISAVAVWVVSDSVWLASIAVLMAAAWAGLRPLPGKLA